jgi:antitoxin (DNA-binding transcriptional repressor) of toxin-antitoxin stability system
MKTMTVTELKSHFSEVLKTNAGETIAVTYGRKKEIVGYFSIEPPRPKKRQLGILQGKAKIIFMDDFEMTTEEFLGL